MHLLFFSTTKNENSLMILKKPDKNGH